MIGYKLSLNLYYTPIGVTETDSYSNRNAIY